MSPSTPAWTPLLQALPDAAWVVDLADGRVVAANATAEAFFGCAGGGLVGAAAEQLVASPEDLAYWSAAAQGEVAPLTSDTVVALADGRALPVSRSIRPLPAAAGGKVGFVLVVLSDRSAERRIEAEREDQLADLRATLEATADGVLVTDANGRVRAFNRRYAELWGMPLALLQQHDDQAVAAWMLRSVDDGESYLRRLRALEHAAQLSATDRLQLHSGRVLERVTHPLYRAGRPQGRVWSFRDETERVLAQERIETLTLRDHLTGLPNRRTLQDLVADAADHVRKHGGGFALLVVGLDRFQRVNDSLGNESGDRVLMDVAQRMQGGLRQGDVLARLGGDQFALLLPDADADAAHRASNRLLNVVAQPCNLDGAQFTLTCSIGIALAPNHGLTVDELVRHAEVAMRGAKRAGRNGARLHQVRAEGDRRSHMKLDHAMRQALVSSRFRLHYQPQVRLSDGAVVGAEALLRWRDPELGEVSPARFVAVAEETGFIVEIGEWVLRQAVHQAALWLQRGRRMPVAINVSALQFQRADFAENVQGVLALSGLPPALLELELTERILVDADDALQRLNVLAGLGVQLSIDDFGIGYSNLDYLRRFPVRKLKIDRSFVADLPGDEKNAAIVRAILQMARALGKRVIAEGVETVPQHHFLQQEGCDEFQGHLYSPALDALSFEQRVPFDGPGGPAHTRSRMRLVRG